MTAQGLLNDRRFMRAAILMAALLVVIWTSEIVAAGMSIAAPVVSDIAAVLCAAIAAFLLIRAWRKMSEEEVSKKVWGLVALGIVLWTLAEAAWAFYELVLQVELPYPSFADLLWFAGYVPLYAALLLRFRSFQSGSSALQRRLVLLFLFLYSLVLLDFVVKPILETFDPSRLAEGITNIAYPLLDWGLCVLTLVIIFALERGRFASVWHLFGAGILLMTTADLLFFYATWNEFYYPGGHLNLISGAVDGLFNLSYLMMGLAVYAYALLAGAFPTLEISMELRALQKMEVLLFVNPEGCILSVSDNFMNLVQAEATKPYIGMDLPSALGLDAVAGQKLLASLVERKSISNYPMLVRGAKGNARLASLTSLLMLNEEGNLNSIALVLRADALPAGETEIPLHEDQRMLIDYYLTKSGTTRIEENQAIRAYFLAHINLLCSLIRQFSGPKVGDTLLEHLTQTARLNNWQFSHSGQKISIPEDFGGQSLVDLLLPLLQEARDFTIDVTDRRMVEQEMKTLDKNLAPEMLRILDKCNFHAALKTALDAPAASAQAA